MNLLKFIDHIDLSHMPEGSFWADFYRKSIAAVAELELQNFKLRINE